MVYSRRSPTLEEIAEIAGVSRSTVSRVINAEPNVRPEVRERVWRVVEEMGYHPHAAARSLASNRSQVLGIVIPETVNTVFADPFFPVLLQGVSDASNDHGYYLMLSMISRPARDEFYRRALRSKMLDGVIIASAMIDDPLIGRLCKDRVPCVVIGRNPQQPDISYVDADNRNGGRLATAHLIAQGRRRIATISGPLRMIAALERLEGYKEALGEAGMEIDESLIAEGDFSEASGYAGMQKLLPHKPDAVFVASDLMAMGALRALNQAGCSVPDEIALVGFDDSQVATYTTPPLTTIRQPVYELGATAANMLIRLVEHEAQEPLHVILPTQLVIRASCGARR